MKTTATRTVYCPICHKGRIMDAAAQTDIRALRLYGPRQAAKAEWFAKCPKCGAQIGITFSLQSHIGQQRAGA